MTTLKELILSGLGYESSWGIWATKEENGNINLDSEARTGQLQFENGGVLDEKHFLGTNEQILNSLSNYGGEIFNEDYPLSEWIDTWWDEVGSADLGQVFVV